MGYDFLIMSPDIDEKAIRNEDPMQLVLSIAQAKADELLKQITGSSILITSDQVILWNNQIREKPENEKEARLFLKSYSDHVAETITSVVVTNIESKKQVKGVDVVKIYFKPIPDNVIDDLIEDGEIMWCAGGFMVEHELLKPFIDSMEGSIDSVMGLPKKLTKELIEKVE